MGHIGGFYFGLYSFTYFILGGYMSFNMMIEVMTSLYSEDADEKVAEKSEDAKYEGGEDDNIHGIPSLQHPIHQLHHQIHDRLNEAEL